MSKTIKVIFFISLTIIINSLPSCKENENNCSKCNPITNLCPKCIYSEIYDPDLEGGCIPSNKCQLDKNNCVEYSYVILAIQNFSLMKMVDVLL